MKLLIDVGNTRLKWAYAEGGRLIEGGSAAHGGRMADALAGMKIDDKPGSIAIASVAGDAQGADLARVCATRWQLQPLFAQAEPERRGLRNGYADPQRLGVDRWLAMLAAWNIARGACVVADAGTALTVDAVDESGQHLGGIIAAGLQTSERAVLGATRFPVRKAALRPHAGLGLDTEDCVRQGAMLSCLGALDRAAAHLPLARRFLTGGDAPTLLPLLTSPWEYRPSLVLEGLLVFLEP